MGLFDGKVVVVTGAGGGIGRAEALAFAREGARIVVNDLGVARDGSEAGKPMAEAVAAEIRAAGGEAVADTHSVSEPEQAEAIIQTALASFGRLDVLVNNAGILRDKTILKMTDDQWDLVQAVHLRGSFLCLRAACRVMVEQGEGGSIVNTSSTSGVFGNYGQANYGAAKSGIAGLTRVAALEMTKHNIRVNALVPVAKTRMTEEIDAVSKELGPEWIPPVVVYLASELSKGVTGRIFGAEGGKIREYYYETTPGIERTDRPWTPQEVAERWRDVVKRAAGGAGIGEDDLDALVMKGIPAGVDPVKARGWNACLHVDLIDGDGYTLTATNGRCTTRRGLHGEATCVLTTDEETAYGVFRGEIDGTQAYMKGKLKISNVSDIMKFTEVYDPKAAREAQSAAGEIEEVAEDLTPHGVNRACAGATFRGSATLAPAAAAEDLAATPPLHGARWMWPLVQQASFAIAAPEVCEKMALAEHLIEIVSPIRPKDLIYPVLKISGVDSDEAGDSVLLETTLRADGELIQRHVLTYRFGESSAAAAPEHIVPPDVREPLAVSEAGDALAPPAVVVLAKALHTVIEQQFEGDSERVRRINSVFVKDAPGRKLEVVAWRDAVSENGLRELSIEVRDAEEAEVVAFATVWFS